MFLIRFHGDPRSQAGRRDRAVLPDGPTCPAAGRSLGAAGGDCRRPGGVGIAVDRRSSGTARRVVPRSRDGTGDPGRTGVDRHPLRSPQRPRARVAPGAGACLPAVDRPLETDADPMGNRGGHTGGALCTPDRCQRGIPSQRRPVRTPPRPADGSVAAGEPPSRRRAGRSVWPGVTSISWRPGRLTLVCLAVAMIFPIWLSGLSANVCRGADAKVYYAAAVLDAHGGNPNDSAALIEEGEVLFNRPNGTHRGEPGAYYMAPYGFPRLFTRFSRPFIGLGVTGYSIAVLAATTIGSLLGLEALMTGLDGDRGRWLPRLFVALSAPFAEDAFVGNVSAALFLSWAVAFLLARRGRPLLAGLVLSICLIKAPVGVPAAAALVAFPPPPQGSISSAGWSRVRLAGGLVIGTAAWVAINVGVAGWEATLSWWQSMVGYGQALGTGPGGAYNLVDQAGLPSVLLGHMPALVAIAIAAIPVGCVMAIGMAMSRRGDRPAPPGTTTALALSGALLLSPYLHLNDLLLEALPLLIIAVQPPTGLARFTLVVWAVGASVNLLVALIEAGILHTPRPGGPAGVGLVLTLLAFFAVAETVGRRTQFAVARAG